MPTATATDPQSLIAYATSYVSSIATLPEVTTNIIRTVEDPRSSAIQLNKIIAHDPALVTRILKTVNSSFYGLPGQVSSVERAITLLGLNGMKNIAVAASLGQLFRGVKLYEKFTAKDLWTHCASVATIARYLAKEMKIPNADEAFLAGMIHDIGILIELQVWPEKLRMAFAKAATGVCGFCEAEREMIGIDHQQLGEAIAKIWKFPKACQLVAAHHHDPASLEASDRQMPAIVYVADTLCCQANAGLNLTAIHQTLEAAGIDGIPPALIEQTRTNLAAILEASKGLF